MREYKHVYNSQWRKDHLERAREIGRESARRYRATERGKEYQRNYQRKRNQRKKEEARAIRQQQEAEQAIREQQEAERWGNLPPLHPIWKQLSRALEKQQTTPAQETVVFPEPSDTTAPSQSPTPERPPTK